MCIAKESRISFNIYYLQKPSHRRPRLTTQTANAQQIRSAAFETVCTARFHYSNLLPIPRYVL